MGIQGSEWGGTERGPRAVGAGEGADGGEQGPGPHTCPELWDHSDWDTVWPGGADVCAGPASATGSCWAPPPSEPGLPRAPSSTEEDPCSPPREGPGGREWTPPPPRLLLSPMSTCSGPARLQRRRARRWPPWASADGGCGDGPSGLAAARPRCGLAPASGAETGVFYCPLTFRRVSTGRLRRPRSPAPCPRPGRAGGAKP